MDDVLIPAPLEAARALAPGLRALSPQIELQRRLPDAIVATLSDQGLLQMSVARDLGGPEVDLATQLQVIEALAGADAAVGWCVMIASTTALVGSYLEEPSAREIYARDPRVVTCGVYAPRGRAVAAPGGYRVTGRWPFASGCEHSAWRLGGAIVHEEGRPRVLADGKPDFRLMFFPAADTEVIDTWSVSGLCGTGSHDLAVRDAFVPAGRTLSPFADRPLRGGRTASFPLFGFLALEVAAVALGIARASIDALVALASEKVPAGGRRTLGQRSAVQSDVARAEVLARSARALLFSAVDEVWAVAAPGVPTPLPLRASLRLAATNAVLSSAQAVDLMYSAGGGTSIYDTSPLQRHFRDIHVLTQHAMVAPPTYEAVGRQLLGLEADASEL